MCKCSKNTVYCDKAPVLSCAIMMIIIIIKYYAYFMVFCYSKIANTAYDSCMFGVVYSSRPTPGLKIMYIHNINTCKQI